MSAQGQKAALKTNILYDAFMNINVGMEVGPCSPVDAGHHGDFNAWTLSHDRRWKHWIVRPRRGYGSATGLRGISWVFTPTEGSITPEG